jgi:hypothetical protein
VKLKNKIKFRIKKLLIILFILILPNILYAGNVYVVQYASQADLKVYIVNYESQADITVKVVKYQSQARGKDALWYFVKYASQADIKIFFVKYASQADLKIKYVEYESQARWRKQHAFRGRLYKN